MYRNKKGAEEEEKSAKGRKEKRCNAIGNKNTKE